MRSGAKRGGRRAGTRRSAKSRSGEARKVVYVAEAERDGDYEQAIYTSRSRVIRDAKRMERAGWRVRVTETSASRESRPVVHDSLRKRRIVLVGTNPNDRVIIDTRRSKA